MNLFGMTRREPMNSDEKYFKFEKKCMIIPNSEGKKGKKIVCGLVYANWCGHCLSLKPEWVKMVKNINQKVKKNQYIEPIFVPFEQSKIDLLREFNEKNSQYLDNKSISYNGFPTVFKINNGKISYYDGKREANSMEKWFMAENMKKSTDHMRTKHKKMKQRTIKNRTRNQRSP